MAQQINVNIRMDRDIKEQADSLFSELGFSFTAAVNAFVRQSLRERAIPFTIRAKTSQEKYDEYFVPEVMARLKESIAQVERNEVITFTMAELKAMEDGEMPQRAMDFLESHRTSEDNNHA